MDHANTTELVKADPLEGYSEEAKPEEKKENGISWTTVILLGAILAGVYFWKSGADKPPAPDRLPTESAQTQVKTPTELEQKREEQATAAPVRGTPGAIDLSPGVPLPQPSDLVRTDSTAQQPRVTGIDFAAMGPSPLSQGQLIKELEQQAAQGHIPAVLALKRIKCSAPEGLALTECGAGDRS